MGLTISSRSPAMAYSEGGLWVSTFDEIGRRCWVNNISGERTYQFVGGKPVTSTDSPYPLQQSPMPSPHAAPWAHSMQSPVPPSPLQNPVPPSPGYPAPLPSNHGGGAGVMVSYQAAQAAGYGGGPPVTPTGNGGWAQRLQRCYVRPSSDRSWMWNS